MRWLRLMCGSLLMAGTLTTLSLASGSLSAGAASTTPTTFQLPQNGEVTLPEATLGHAYDVQLLAPSGYPASAPFAVVDNGHLPLGLTLSSSGLLSGKPDLPQSTQFFIVVGTYGSQYYDPVLANLTVGTGEASADPTAIQLGNFLAAAYYNASPDLSTLLGLPTTVENLVSFAVCTVEAYVGLFAGPERGAAVTPQFSGPPC